MSEYKKEVTLAVAVVVIGVLALATLANLILPMTSNTTGNRTSSLSQTSTFTSFVFTSTIPKVSTYTSGTLQLDPRLVVNPMGDVFQTSSNATQIAQKLASFLGELPLQLTRHIPASCNDAGCSEVNFPYSTAVDLYAFQTARGSNITVEMIQERFFELQYFVKNYSSLHNDYWNNHPAGNPPNSTEDASVRNLLLQSFNLDLSKTQVDMNVTGPGWAQWSQEYNGLNIANSGQVYFEVYPPTSKMIELIIVEDGGNYPPTTINGVGLFLSQYGDWHIIPSNFTLSISSSIALNDAKAFATNVLHMGFIGYASVSLQIVSDHLYYAATVSDSGRSVLLFVNPISGEVGSPTS